MIPYDDLVAALSTWRARQGLPVSTMAGTPQAAPQAAAAIPGSGPRTAPPAPPPRTSPPAAPPSRAKPVSVPPPLAHPEEEEVDAALIDEAHYENEGADFAMAFGESGGDGEGATAIGAPPQRDTQPSRGRRKDEW